MTLAFLEKAGSIDSMSKINPKKLLNSKWTAVAPQNREKHFVVTKIKFEADDSVIYCALEAVLSKRKVAIQWEELKDASQWLQGWK